MKSILKKNHKNSERGQAIILIAFAIIGMVAIVGLMTDSGILLIEYARLKRGIDSASVAAASQFRLGFVGADLQKAGEEFLKFNQSGATVTITTCNYPGTSHDDTLCVPFAGPNPRKLVRVTATRHVDFGFMRVIGINGTDISATSVGEAASLDMVLVIDTSSSMAYDTTVGGSDLSDPADPLDHINHPGDDPVVCNAHMGIGDPKRCQPLGAVIDVAMAFINKQFFPYDRVSLVTLTSQTPDGDRNPVLKLPFTNNLATVQTALSGLKVQQPPICDQVKGPCLIFDPYYHGQKCVPFETPPNYDPTTCGASNIGGGLYMAGDQFAYARQEAFWVVIALIGGPANATSASTETPTPAKPDGYCPTTTFSLTGGAGFCRDLDPKPIGYNPPTNNPTDPATKTYMASYDWSTYDSTIWATPQRPTRHIKSDVDNYDSDDYARDGADYITSPKIGQGAVLFSICMGPYCKTYRNVNDPASAQHLGEYMAYHAGDDLTAVPPVIANHGLYSYAAGPSDLGPIFTAIAKNIQTRISQ